MKKTGNGFSRETYAVTSKDSVYKIVYHDNLDNNTYRVYYFKDNKLILAKLRLEANGQGDILFESEHFYLTDELVAQRVLIRNRKFGKRIRELQKVDNVRAAYEMLQEYFATLKEDNAALEEIRNGR